MFSRLLDLLLLLLLLPVRLRLLDARCKGKGRTRKKQGQSTAFVFFWFAGVFYVFVLSAPKSAYMIKTRQKNEKRHWAFVLQKKIDMELLESL
jgi:hypothetical protein